jgi:repressor LexA
MKSRALRPVHAVDDNSADDLVRIPIVGRVAAGEPVLAEQNIEENITVDRFLVGAHREVFGLRVRGDSMIDAGIRDGDFVFVRKQMLAERGQIVVAMIGDEATVKYYHPEREQIRLVAANPAYAPIVVRRDQFRPTQILGVVVGLYRRF